MSGKPGAWVMALSPDEKTLLVPGAGRGNIVRINTITHQKEDFPAGNGAWCRFCDGIPTKKW
ncbi:outer membrane protein [Escherichia coli]|uniref:Outer membrane protein n=1 Tax=Escherichia coli TaxID=562 RepID=A0A376VZQ6_ECOLX|nr:outer membrane protein [Escherichia coli]